MIVSFFVASVAVADETSNSKENHNSPGYLGPPFEVPTSSTFDVQIKKFFIELFDLPWEIINPKQDFYLDPPGRN